LAAVVGLVVIAIAIPALGVVGRLAKDASALPSAGPARSVAPPSNAPSAELALRTVVPFVPGPMAIAVGANRVWVASAGAATLTRLDPDGVVEGGVSLRTLKGGWTPPRTPPAIGLAGDDVWVGGIPAASDLVEVDGRTVAIVRRLRLPSPAIGLVGGFGAAWVGTADGRLIRVRTNGAKREVIRPAPGPISLAVGSRYVWASRAGTTTAVRSDGTIAARFHAGGGSIGVRDRTAWVIGDAGGSRDLTAIDEGTLRVTYRSDVGTSGFSGIAWALPSITPTLYTDTDTLVAPRSPDSALVGDVAWIARPIEGEVWRIGASRAPSAP
jgi:hypothetical protein